MKGGEKRNACKILVGKPEEKRPLGRRRSRRVDNIKVDLREIRLGGVDWIDMAQDREQWRALVNTGSIKCWEVAAQLTAPQELSSLSK
jgi:hypothetical protein